MHKSVRTDRRGNMPFAIVAVTILLIASSYCAVTSSIRETEKDADNLVSGIDALDDSISAVSSFVESGFGEILHDVSTSTYLGTLDKRSSEFYERADRWISLQFPMFASGTIARLTDYSVELKTENLQLGSEFTEMNGYTPSYLKAEAKLSLVFESEVGSSSKTISVSTDGSCALPLTIEQGSLFENSVAGDGSVLSQMVSYQLTSLAQYRVINGYGARSYYGEKGTESIITSEDVKAAYRNAVNALECMYFRDSSGNIYFGDTDLAKEFVSDNERISINLNAVYAQALSAHIDDIVGKWFDYFLGNYAVSAMDSVSDTLQNAWDSLTSFFTGQNSFSAAPYIKEIVGDTYTGVRTGERFTLSIANPDTGEVVSYQAYYPSVDLYKSSCISNFKNDYRSNTNSIKEWMYSVANTAIGRIADRNGMGTIVVSTDDQDTFADLLSTSISDAIANGVDSFEKTARETVSAGDIPDQFYYAIYDTLERNRNAVFSYDRGTFIAMTADQLGSAVAEDFSSEGHQVTAEEAEAMIEDAFAQDANKDIIASYQYEVDSLLSKLGGLKTVPGSDDSLIKTICLTILEGDFMLVDCTSDIGDIAIAMCSEYESNISVNPYSGFTTIPDSDCFELTEDGRSYTEIIEVSDSSDPIVTIGKATDRSSHETGFNESKYASYCTVIPITISDTLSYEVHAAGTLLNALGIDDSSFGNSADIDLSVEIKIVSGWGLVGVEYTSSTNVLQDLYNTLLQILEPLLEPLRRIMEMAQDILDKISQAVMVIAQYLNEFIEEIYNAIMEPLEKIGSLFTEKLTEVFCEQIIDISEQAQAIVDVSAVGQTVGLTYMGYTLKFTFNMATLEKYTKNIVKAEFEGEVSGIDVTAFVNVKTKGETKKVPYITGGFTITGSDWNLEGKIDPTMTTNKNLVSLSGTVKGVKIDAVLPEAVQYNEIGIALSDFPGIGTILENIPSPIPGTKINLDAGVSLKYNVPIESGVLINEFESNPEGTDKDKEWVEILNLSGTSVDLNNWTVTTSKGKVHVIKDIELNAGERTVIYFSGTFLLNSKEYLILKDPDGVEVDRSSTMSDSANDSRTCQRGMDGSTEWSLIEGTPDGTNKGGLFGENGMVTSAILEIVKKAAVKAMNELKHVYTTEALEELFVRTVRYAVDDGIDTLSSCIVEGSIYISVDFTDLSSTGRSGFKVYVMADSDLVGDVLKYLLGKAEALFLNIDDPYNIDLGSVVYDDVYLGVSVYGGIKTPSFLGTGKHTSDKVTLGVDIACNLSALGGLLGADLGTPKVKAQIGIRNCPYELIPSALGVKKNMTYDLWFIRMTFTAA